MYVFKKLSLNKVPHIVSWYLVIKNKYQLQELSMNEISTNMISDAMTNFIDVVNNKKHFKNNLAYCAQYKAELQECSFAEALSKLSVELTQAQINMLEKGYDILIHPNLLSWTADKNNELYTTLDVHCSEELVFPENDKIHLIQFPGGQHWYVEVGNVQVKIDGKEKWDTKEEAQLAANDYVSQSKISRRTK
jgi:hypothetical protein